MSKRISETAFATQVEDLLELYRWRWKHDRPTWSSRGYRTPMRSGDPDGYKGKGFPDYICVRPPRLIFVELKDENSKPMPEQEAWLEDLKECVKQITYTPIELGKRQTANQLTLVPSYEVYLWRPKDIEEIVEALK